MVANLKELRAKNRVSQQALAEAVGASQQTINQYENSKTEPDIFMLTKIADFFDVSVDYLIGHYIGPKTQYDLNADEAALIDKYRMLTPKERESIRLVIENYVN